MRSTTEQTVQPCPQCGTEIRTDRRFTTWCSACDWNVDPVEPDERPGRVERMRRGIAHRYGERLLAEMTGGESRRPRRDVAGVLACTVALCVHGVTVALLLAGVLLVTLGWGGALPVLGAFLLGLAWLLRPRFGRLPDDAPVLHRADAPRLFALIDEVAACAPTSGVHAVAVTAEVNASVSTYGIGQRRLLTLGLGLWEITAPQERVALIGHELGHFAHGDTRHGVIIANALHSLNSWRYLVAPIRNPSGLEVILNALYLLPFLAVQGVMMLLDQLTLRAAQRAEYLADASSATAASTEAAVALQDRLLVYGSAETFLLRESNARQVRDRAKRDEPEQGLWDRLAAYVESIPESEYERRRRVGALRGHSVDSTHPPTHLRRACLLAGPAEPAAVRVDAEAVAAITAELADARRVVARRVLRG
ncbi:M48 family metallopeptidase [Streptomyces sp. NPDC058287]|uniref:M48 family metallopeptidase n=1 Tax=Streptomyces sp. NPDC058287 TaxID=3346423 RepID=UPI0036EDEFD5